MSTKRLCIISTSIILSICAYLSFPVIHVCFLLGALSYYHASNREELSKSCLTMVEKPADLARVAIFVAQQADSGDVFMDKTFRELVLRLCSLAAPLKERQVAFLNIARSSPLSRATGRAAFMVNIAFKVGLTSDQITHALTH